MKLKFGEKLDKKKSGQAEYENILEKYVDVKKDLDQKISKDLNQQEDEFVRKKRERRERSISKSVDKGRRKKKNDDDDDAIEDTGNLLGGLTGGKSKSKSRNMDGDDPENPFNAV